MRIYLLRHQWVQSLLLARLLHVVWRLQRRGLHGTTLNQWATGDCYVELGRLLLRCPALCLWWRHNPRPGRR